jgi:hypothetical protein
MHNLKLAGGALVAGVVATSAVTAFVGGPTSASEGEGSAGSRGTHPAGSQAPDETIFVVETQARFKFVDVGRKGESLGDYMLSRGTLHDQQGKRVGRVVTRCMLAPKPDLYCDGVYKIRGRGDVVFSNLVNTAKEPPLLGPLVGGDGDFKNITGQLSLDYEGEAAHTNLEIYHHD